LKSLSCQDVPLMDESVEELCRGLDDGSVWNPVGFVLCSRVYMREVRVSSEGVEARKGKEESDEPGSTSKTISRASFQNGTIV